VISDSDESDWSQIAVVTGQFQNHIAVNCHWRYATSNGTPSADPSMISLSSLWLRKVRIYLASTHSTSRSVDGDSGQTGPPEGEITLGETTFSLGEIIFPSTGIL
jgi:hypothetical protein